MEKTIIKVVKVKFFERGERMINIAQPQMGDEEIAAVTTVLRSGRLVQDETVSAFECAFTEFVGARFGIACGNGTEALHLALLAAGIGHGSRVLTTPFTFAATVTAILMCGAEPVFADIDPDTYCMNDDDFVDPHRGRITHRLPVHLYGHPVFCGHDAIYDACQAHGAEMCGYPLGYWGTSCWSFYATKNMTTGGEGGMVTTNDPEEADRLRLLRNHGSRVPYQYEMLGYNYRMTEMQAAIGLAQLSKLPGYLELRAENAAYYSANLRGVKTPVIAEYCVHAWNQYTIEAPDGKRDALVAHLLENGIRAGIYYPDLVFNSHKHFARDYALSLKGRFPHAESAARRVLSLPVHPGLSQEDVEKVVYHVNEFVDMQD